LHTSLMIDVAQPTSLTASYVLFVFAPDAIAHGYVSAVPGARVIPVPELVGLNPQADALMLYTPDGYLIINQVNWGTPDKTWLNYNSNLWNPGLAPLDPATCPACTWGRTPADHNTGLPRPPAGDWTQHSIPSAGGTIPGARPTDFLGADTN